MNVVLITQGVSEIVNPLLSSKFHVCGVVESAPRGIKEQFKAHPLRARFRKIVRWVTGSPHLGDLCKKKRIPYFFLHESNESEFLWWLEKLKVDIVVIYSMSRLLPESVIAIPTHGILNLHPSLLPDYRGPNPWFWVYHDMIQKTGVTLHFIDEGEDTGDLVDQISYNLEPGTHLAEAKQLAIGEIGFSMVSRALESLMTAGIITRRKQERQSPTVRARNVRPEEACRIIDWNSWPCHRIWHLLRGTSSYMDIIEPPRGVWKGHRWAIGSFHPSPKRHKELGQIRGRGLTRHLICMDGVITLHLKPRLLLLLMNLAGRNH